MTDKIQAFKEHVRETGSDPGFLHHAWFVPYHLEIVERIALELLERYPEADADVVMVLVWLHDYGKTLDYANQYAKTLTAGREQLTELGFEPAFVDRVIHYVELIDKKLEIDLREAPLEVKIVSSADAASHHVGPFMSVYWSENPNKTLDELMASNRAKTMKDWDRKMVLPEVREAFEARHKMVLEQAGDWPERFL